MKKTDPQVEQKAIELYKSGLSCVDVAKTMNINSVTVFNILKRNNIETRTKGGIYELPYEQIKQDYLNGVKITEISKKYNVNDRTIYNYLDAIDVERNYIYINQSLRRDYFDNIDTYDKAYFLGFLISDGGIVGNSVTMTLQAGDYYILEIFRKYICNENPLYYHDRADGRHEVTFHCKSKQLVDALAKYGVVERKSMKTYISGFIPSHLLHHLLRGIWDGNGWLSWKGHTLGYCAGNNTIVTQFRDIMVDLLGVTCTKVIQQGPHQFLCSWAAHKDILAIYEYMFQDAWDCFLIRKYNNYLMVKYKYDQTMPIIPKQINL